MVMCVHFWVMKCSMSRNNNQNSKHGKTFCFTFEWQGHIYLHERAKQVMGLKNQYSFLAKGDQQGTKCHLSVCCPSALSFKPRELKFCIQTA